MLTNLCVALAEDGTSVMAFTTQTMQTDPFSGIKFILLDASSRIGVEISFKNDALSFLENNCQVARVKAQSSDIFI